MRSTTAHRHTARSAFTLIEATIASVVLATSVVGLLTMVTAASSSAGVAQQDATALSLARELMELTAAVPFAKPAPDAAGFVQGNLNPSTYDDVRDFAGYTDEVVSSATVGSTSTTAGDGRTYQRRITVVQNAWGTTPADFMLVTVTVTPPHGRDVTLRRLVSLADVSRPE
jgi:Tfp pilus assembly protein PilV